MGAFGNINLNGGNVSCCYNCENRVAATKTTKGCHCTCEIYKAEKEAAEIRKAEIRKKKEEQKLVYLSHICSSKRRW